MEFFTNKEDVTYWIVPTISRSANDLRLVAEKVSHRISKVMTIVIVLFHA